MASPNKSPEVFSGGGGHCPSLPSGRRVRAAGREYLRALAIGLKVFKRMTGLNYYGK